MGTASSLIVRTAQGTLQGGVENGVRVFRGVPYGRVSAALRFCAPKPPAAWSGDRLAVAAGPICPQNDDDGVGAYLAFAQDEDCLNLSIWAPQAPGPHPVLVWFHGGAFVTGTGALSLYDGSTLAREQNIVVVSVNYRLGVLGWPPFQVRGASVSNNLGLLDCVAALQWLRANIAAFGGDPDNVTQSGQSAGAMISAMLGLVPQARGLFAKAAPMSLQTLVALEPERQARYTRAILTALDLGPEDMDKLAAAPVAALLKAQWQVRQAAMSAVDTVEQLRWPFMPNVDGILFTGDPANEMAALRRTWPLLTGATAEELVVTPLQLAANPTAAQLSTRAATLAGLARLFAAAAAERIWRVYAEAYPAASESELSGLIATDKDYRIPALRLAEAPTAQADAFTYTFTYRGRGPYYPNAHHALDLPFWFGTLREPRYAGFFLGGDATEAELALSRKMRDALGAFMRSGDPGWPAYRTGMRETMIFGLPGGAARDPQGSTRAVWEGLIP